MALIFIGAVMVVVAIIVATLVATEQNGTAKKSEQVKKPPTKEKDKEITFEELNFYDMMDD